MARSRSPTAGSSWASNSSPHRQEPSDQGWDGIGSASRIFSRFYAAQTIKGDQVIQLHGEAAPEWFAPLSDWDFKNSKLPLLLGGFRRRLLSMAVLAEPVD